MSSPSVLDPSRAPGAGRRLVAVRAEEDDSSLVDALQAGDRRAPTLLFDRHAPAIARTLARLVGTDPDLPDLLNEVFLRAVDRIDRVTEPTGLRLWLTSIAVTTAREHLRRRARRRWLTLFSPADIEEQAELGACEAPLASPEIRETVCRLYRVLSTLSTDDRLVFTLRYIEQMELTRVASACDTSLSTVKRRLSRAEQRFVCAARKEPVLYEWLEKSTRWSCG
jgi:RNA polymerase sigma-70 factor (ECF subfamily)